MNVLAVKTIGKYHMAGEINARKIDHVYSAQAASDGDGVKIFRSIGSQNLMHIDPFLLLDELRGDTAEDYMGGFPSHPHRGFETVTYMLEGKMRHKDSAGNEGVICAGDIQWMTAGSGIIHSEMPEQTEGKMWGFQFWINLPAAQKMRQPRYQEITSSVIPEVHLSEGKVRVLAGKVTLDDCIIEGAVTDITTQPLLLDVQLLAGQWSTRVSAEHVMLVYVYQGAVMIGGSVIQEQQLAVLSKGECLTMVAHNGPFGALVLAAEAINEPIVRSGPFVMNTQKELRQAFSDYKTGQFLSVS